MGPLGAFQGCATNLMLPPIYKIGAKMGRTAHRRTRRKGVAEQFSEIVNGVLEQGRRSTFKMAAVEEFWRSGAAARAEREEHAQLESVPTRTEPREPVLKRRGITSDAMHASLDLAETMEEGRDLEAWARAGRRRRG